MLFYFDPTSEEWTRSGRTTPVLFRGLTPPIEPIEGDIWTETSQDGIFDGDSYRYSDSKGWIKL